MPRGIYDRDASDWAPPPRKEYPPELVARVRELYEAGHTMREVAELAGTTFKVLQRLMPRHDIARRAAGTRVQVGQKNHIWRGEGAEYQALHQCVEAARGTPNRCACCDTTDPSERYEWANLSGRYEDVNDYARLCLPCHRRVDAARRAATGRRISPPRGGDEDV